jgi:site-specific recombinase XerD
MEFLKKQINNYLKIIKNTKSQTTYKTYETVLRDAINYIEIDNNHLSISGYRLKIASQNRKTIAKKVSILRSFFKYLEDNGYNFRIIGDDQISVPKTLPKPIPIKNIKEALKVADLIEYTAIMTIFGLGLRISEARNLLITNIKNEWITVIGKGNKTRDIPLEKHIKDTIIKYIEIYSPKKYLFEKNGIKMSDAQLRYIIEKPFKKIGIKITPHQLRHSFATEMLNNGARINDVSELLGHEFISTTQIYTKLNSSTKLKNYLKAHPLCSHS